jgi:hypothetical protein
VGKAVSHANQTTLYLTPLHGRADILKRLIANIGAALGHVKAAAEQFKELNGAVCCATSVTALHLPSGHRGRRRGCRRPGNCRI